MSLGTVLIAILGLAVLMVVHESGHYFAARHFGMRVVKFSIGFGPTIWKHQPAGSPTVFQVAIIPFLAYVQIAGMNPYEEIDENDKGSYANASLWGRVVAIFAGPAANYIFATVLFFAGFLITGNSILEETSMRVSVGPGGAAQLADMRDADKIIAVNGDPIRDWEQLKMAVKSHPGEKIDVDVERDGKVLRIPVTPAAKGEKNEGKIQIGPYHRENVPVTVGEAAKLSIVAPAMVVYDSLHGLGRMIMGKEKAELSGPVGIVRQVAIVAGLGAGQLFRLLGGLSAYLALFNLLPIPALDGGRLMFLGFEAIARRRPDAKLEARIHAVGLLMMLALIAIVSVGDLGDIFPRR
jgi:regulator of sigma E protease